MLSLDIEAVVKKGKRRATQHRCPFCKFAGNLAGNWKDGLNVHITKMHKNKLLEGTQLSQQQRKFLEKSTQTADLIKVLSTLNVSQKGNFLRFKADASSFCCTHYCNTSAQFFCTIMASFCYLLS